MGAYTATLALPQNCVCYKLDESSSSRALLDTTTTSQIRILRSHYEEQESVFSAAFRVLTDGIKERAFPGASIAVTQRGEFVALNTLGRFTYDEGSPAVQADTIFDIASVSKVVATLKWVKPTPV